MSAVAQRKYQPIWEALKLSGKVDVALPNPWHKRVIKAVIKEKYNDLGFKILLGERGKKAKISYHSRGGKLTFFLNYSIGVEDL